MTRRSPVPPAQMSSALDPVRVALLQRAREEAGRRLAAADAEATRTIADAQAAATVVAAAARTAGVADAAIVLEDRRRQARRQARARVLQARAQAYEELRQAVRQASHELRGRAEYTAIVSDLQARALAVLGPGAAFAEAVGGGLVASRGTRRLDLSLDRLAEQALERLGPEVEGLWRS